MLINKPSNTVYVLNVSIVSSVCICAVKCKYRCYNKKNANSLLAEFSSKMINLNCANIADS